MVSAIPNVLIVESDSRQSELVIELVRDVVRAKIDTTDSSDRAVELVGKTPYQLVIADLDNGSMEGLLILDRVKHVSPSTSVILTSTYATIEEAVKAMRSGADEYFKKPFDPEKFKLAIRRCLDKRDLYAAGDKSVLGLMHLLSSCQIISGCLDEERIFENVTSYVKRETDCEAIALFKVKDGQRTHVATSLDQDVDVIDVILEGHNFLQVFQEEKTSMKVVPKTGGTPEVALFQFRCDNDSIYYIVCLSPKWNTPPDAIDSRYRLLQAQVFMTGKTIQNYKGVRNLLYLDEPTGLGNTRHLHSALDGLFGLLDKTPGFTFSVLFMDVDKFKGINDQHGHLVGTKLLLEMGQILKKCISDKDMAFRYGGDEFVVVLLGANSQRASKIAEKIRTEVEKNAFLSEEGLNVKLTVSIGIANAPEHASSKRDVLDAADNAMYIVKRTSRNKVYIADKKAA